MLRTVRLILFKELIKRKSIKSPKKRILRSIINIQNITLINGGKSKDTNILWVTGISGSGKSTIAKKHAKVGNADLINIDLYTFKTADKYLKDMSKRFNKYLDKHYPNWKKMQKEGYEALTKTDRRLQKKAGLWFDTFQEALENYGRDSYPKKKIVAEGVQILDETLFYKNKQALKGQPLIVMDTSVIDSIISRAMRDNKSIDKLLEPERVKQLEGWLKDKDYLNMVIR